MSSVWRIISLSLCVPQVLFAKTNYSAILFIDTSIKGIDIFINFISSLSCEFETHLLFVWEIYYKIINFVWLVKY